MVVFIETGRASSPCEVFCPKWQSNMNGLRFPVLWLLLERETFANVSQARKSYNPGLEQKLWSAKLQQQLFTDNFPATHVHGRGSETIPSRLTRHISTPSVPLWCRTSITRPYACAALHTEISISFGDQDFRWPWNLGHKLCYLLLSSTLGDDKEGMWAQWDSMRQSLDV